MYCIYNEQWQELTGFPQRRSHIVVTVKTFCKLMRFLQNFTKQEKLLRCKMWKHAIVFLFDASSHSCALHWKEYFKIQ